MRRFSIYLLYGIVIVIVLATFDFVFTRNLWLEQYEENFAWRVSRLHDEAILARMLYEAERSTEHLPDLLESRRRQGDVGDWIIMRDNQIVATSVNDDIVGSLQLSGSEGVMYFDRPTGIHYVIYGLGDGHKLLLGLTYDRAESIRKAWKINKGVALRYVAFLLVLTMLIFVFFFRDIMRAIREFNGRKEKRRFSRSLALSKEADLLVRGLQAYDVRTRELEEENELFSLQVLPSLRKELQSGIEPPYHFSCTLVRTDINNFSKIYNEYPVEEFGATINEFFTEASHVIARYGGYVHEFVGDEVIYYFKDEEVGNSVVTALSAIRDINEIAGRFHEMTSRDRGYGFTVKSALAHDRLRFARLVNGFGLSGPGLIETVRVVSHVAEKDGNVVVFDERHLEQVGGLVGHRPYAEVHLKGFTQARRLVAYSAHRPIQECLAWGDLKQLENLAFYRDDMSLVRILGWLDKTALEAPVNEVFRVIGVLRAAKLTRLSSEVRDQLASWLNHLLDVNAPDQAASEDRVRILAAALRLTENFAPPGRAIAEFEKVLERALMIKDRRVVANALDALSAIRRDHKGWVESLTVHQDNRVAANALVHEGLREISPYVVRRLKKMLHARQPLRVSSALYAMGEIALYHRKRDRVYFNTRLEFQDLLKEIPSYVAHEDEHVRRQAMNAVRKIADTELTQAAWALTQGQGQSGRQSGAA